MVRYFAAAAEAAGVPSETLSARTVGELLSVMAAVHGRELEHVLTRCSVLVDGRRLDPTAALSDGDLADVLPPFAGG